MKCYINMTEPALYKGCAKDKEDSDYYVYSIQGFDPCFFYDFTKSYTFKYLLQCRGVNSNGVVVPGGHPEGVGYKYKNVVYKNTTKPLFNYKAVNMQTGTKLFEADTPNVTLTFDFRDWKYLSQIERFTSWTDDPDVVVGNKEGTFDVDFNKMTQRDQKQDTKFEVGGRMFFEANVFASGYVSFTTNGFLDKLGYVEPRISKTQEMLAQLKWLWILLGILGLSFIILSLYCCF